MPLFSLHCNFSSVEKRIEECCLVSAMRRERGLSYGRPPDRWEAVRIIPGTVHHYGVVIDELAQLTQLICVCLPDGGVEIDVVPFVVLRGSELRIFGCRLPCLDKLMAESCARRRAVHIGQRRQERSEQVGGRDPVIVTDHFQHIVSGGGEPDDAAGVPAILGGITLDVILDIGVLRLPIKRGGFRTRNELHCDILFHGVAQPAARVRTSHSKRSSRTNTCSSQTRGLNPMAAPQWIP